MIEMELEEQINQIFSTIPESLTKNENEQLAMV
jgi:hypothetical protein